MNPFLQLAIFFAVLGAWPVYRVWQRQRRARGTHDSHRPGHRQQPANPAHGHAQAAQGVENIREAGGL